MRAQVFWSLVLATGLSVQDAQAQTRSALNPEISFISDVRAVMESSRQGDVEFRFEELEIAGTAPLNPFANGAIYLGLHDGQIEIEEGFVDFTALPGRLSLRAGQMFVDQGRFNPLHNHTFSFLDYPALVTGFFGEEGLRGVGVRPGWLFGLDDVAITFSANALTTEVEPHEEENAIPAEPAPARAPFLEELTYSGRVSAFFPLGDVSNMDVGAGGGTRVIEPEDDLRASWFGADFKYKWRPDTRRSLTVAAEFLIHQQDLETAVAKTDGGDREVANGFFAYFDLQLAKHWNFGALVDFAQQPTDSDRDRTGAGAFFGYSIFAESTLLRLLVRHDSQDNQDDTNVQIQLVSSLGPHKPHQF